MIQPRLYLISCSDLIDLTLKGKSKNHTTYENSEESHMATFHELTPKSSPSYPTQGFYPHLLARGCEPAAFSMLIVLALRKGEVHPVRHTPLPTQRSCRLCRFTVPHKHGM